ncbi:MAG: inorganic phosphate transporter [Bacteroidota bacterium]|jgi:phosphate/sulfate permease|nr:inorganic phosphate transporter [Cytophagales bacterium]MCE2956618.1 inorganic phosphate transporter [Flammeovirgaceae bacterium]
MITFQIIIGVLVVLAIADLIVGVSNDAVNFLNSAVGSKAAPFRTILIIASIGVVVGTLFSNGMMQIARNGIFQPEFFTFDKVMIIFLAVMLTDVILLDVYNTLGLPTSTTVSLIFELLGASFTVGVLYLIDQHQPVSGLRDVINHKGALIIIGGIFFSVLVAFVVGTGVHFFARLIFTFRLKKSLRTLGPVFTGISVTVIFYFLLIKGLEGSTLVGEEEIKWVSSHTLELLSASLVLFTLITAIAMRFSRFNPLRMIVLLGTFSLAMAFAGNDLVNFIGVSVAAYSSYSAWSASGLSPDQFNMDVLNEQVSTPSLFLLGAGVIMVLTLWLSAKSRKVTETEVSLGRQSEGDEKFQSSTLSRWLVGGVLFVGNHTVRHLPEDWKQNLTKRLTKPVEKKRKADDPSFDLLRASVNLIASSALIAYGTSNRLPLSTTFVTFMVAMGSSFADQAWGRESAVYRVSGVIQVISGWLATALVAFVGSALVGLILYFTGFPGVVVISIFTFGLLAYSQFEFKRTEKSKAADELTTIGQTSITSIMHNGKLKAAENVKQVQRLLAISFKSLLLEESLQLKEQKRQMKNLALDNKKKIIKYIRNVEPKDLQAGRLNLQVFDVLQDLYQSADLIADICREHVMNYHSRPSKSFEKIMVELENKSTFYFSVVEQAIKQMDFNDWEKEMGTYADLREFIADCLDDQVREIQQGEISNRLALVQTRILLEMTDVIESTHQLYQLYQAFSSSYKNETLLATSV